MTLIAQWSINTHRVTYDTNGGSGSFSTATHNYGTNHKVSSTKPTRTHFTFVNWTRGGSGGGTVNPGDVFSVTYNTTLTANWRRNTSTVSYNANGGSGAPGSQTKQHGVNLTLSGTKPTRAGYTFLGWNTNSSGTGTNYSSGGSYTANSNVTLYARWSANSYSVTYDKNGGSGGPSNTTGTYGGTFTINKSSIPSRSGYVFVGWDYGSSRYNPNSSITMPMGNITFKAQWLPASNIKTGARIRLRAGSQYTTQSNGVESLGRTIPDSHTVGQNLYIYQMGGGSGSKWSTNTVVFGTVKNNDITGSTNKANIILQQSGVTYR